MDSLIPTETVIDHVKQQLTPTAQSRHPVDDPKPVRDGISKPGDNGKGGKSR